MVAARKGRPPRPTSTAQVIKQLHEDAPLIYLYRQKNFTGVAKSMVGVQVYGDGLLRFVNAGFAA